VLFFLRVLQDGPPAVDHFVVLTEKQIRCAWVERAIG
jgi:hypothetical protein